MAKIVVLVSNPCTKDARVIKMARMAVESGHDVHIFATLGPDTLPFEQIEGISYHRMYWSPVRILMNHRALKWSHFIGKRLRRLLFSKISPFIKYSLFTQIFFPHAIAINPDLVHAHDLICLPAGFRIAKACGAKLIYDAHELEVHRNPPLPFLQKQYVSYIERKYAYRADAINTVGMLVRNELAKHIKRDDIQVLYNSPPLDPCPKNIRDDLGIDDKSPLILYVGKVAIGRGVDGFLELLPHMPGVIFSTVGPCDEKSLAGLEKKAERLGVASRFRVLPPVPFEQVVSYIQGADLGVISVEPITLSYKYCMPNKLFELSFANIPIISNKLDEIEMYISEFKNGKIVDFSEISSMPYIIFCMLRDKEKYTIDKDKLEALNNKYSWKNQAEKLRLTYDNLLNGGK